MLSINEATLTEKPKMEERRVSLGDMEAKIDKILEYQKSAHTWSVVRGIISFIFLFVFIILPIIGTFYLIKNFGQSLGGFDLGKLSSQYGELSKTLDQLKSGGGAVGNLDQLMKQRYP